MRIFLLFLPLLFSLPAHATRLGFVVIDVQKSFVEKAANPDMRTVLAHTEELFRTADSKRIPFYITYEASKSGDHDIPTALKRALPRHQKDFIKTTFAATGLSSFAQAMRESGITHLVLLGAETDVCVMQTALGLRAMGFEVLLQKDAVFSSEPNVSPALRRMERAGVRLVSMTETRAWIDGKPLPSPVPQNQNSVIVPVKNGRLQVALVLNQLTEANLRDTSDRWHEEKLQRLRELLIVAAWFELPVYVPGGSSFEIPRTLQRLLGRRAMVEVRKIRTLPLSRLGSESQVFVAGTAPGLDATFASLKGKQTFLLEDATLGAGAGRALPITYKSLYYGLIRSVSMQEWPLRRWAERDERFFPMLEELEGLKPIRLD